MDADVYVELTDRTCKHIGDDGATIDTNKYDLLHATLGIAGESGELVDAIKKHVIYNKPLDIENVREEVGDIMWYIALLCRTLDFKLGDIFQENIDKLAKRYPEKYSDELAVKRLDKQ